MESSCSRILKQSRSKQIKKVSFRRELFLKSRWKKKFFSQKEKLLEEEKKKRTRQCEVKHGEERKGNERRGDEVQGNEKRNVTNK